MNRVFKSIWNSVTQSWTAVSEAQKVMGKRNKASVRAGLALLLFFSLSGNANAVYWGWNVGIKDLNVSGFGVGASAEVLDDDLYIGPLGGTQLNIVGSDKKIDISANSTQLFNQSRGFDQQIFRVTGSLSHDSGIQAKDFELTAQNGGTSNFSQQIIQNEQVVADAYYALGKDARDLLISKLGYQPVHGSDDRITVNGKQYGSTGISMAYDSGSETGFWTVALLKQVDLKSELLLSTGGTDQIWSAKVTGDGAIQYSGGSTITIISALDNDENTYQGETTVDNVDLILEKQDSLGQTFKLIAINSKIDVENSLAWSSVKNLSYQNTSTVFGSEQNQFQVDNGTGDAATFVGNNEITTEHSAFTYGVVGSMEIGDVASGQVGDLTFKPDGTLSLEVGDDLTIYANSKLNGATNISVSDALNLYSTEGIDGTSTLRVGNALNFIDIEAQSAFSHDVSGLAGDDDTFKVTLSNSDITYDSGLKLSAVSETSLQNGSTLSVTGVGQLGSVVYFAQSTGTVDSYNKLIIQKNDELAGNDGTWTFGNDLVFNSVDSNAIIVAQGDGQGTRFTIPAEQRNNWKDYSGWLRLVGTTLTINTDLGQESIFSHVGLSVGSDATVNLATSTTLDRFGWSKDGDGSGVLDLSSVIPEEDDAGDLRPVLSVGEIWIDAEGTIKLDPQKYLQAGSTLSGGSVLDYQNGSDRYYIIEADNIKVTVEDSGEIIHLEDVNKVTGQDTATLTDLYHPNTTNVAAQASWDYVLDVDHDNQDKDGVYLTYALSELILKGEQKSDHSLVLNLGDASETDLGVKLSGEGIIDINGAGEKNTVSFSNSDNSFEGQVNVGENVQFTASEGSLGVGNVALSLSEGATYTLKAMESVTGQTLNGLSLAEKSHIYLEENSELILDLNTTSYLASDVVKINADQISGKGSLTLAAGTLSFSNVDDNLFTNLAGDIKVESGATMNFTADQDYTLKEIHGEGKVGLFTDRADQTTTLGNLGDFQGAVVANGSVNVKLSNQTILNSAGLDLSSQNSKGSKVIFDQYRSDEQGTDFVIDEGLSLSGFDTVAFNNMTGVFEKENTATDAFSLELNGNSSIIRQQNSLDKAYIGNGSSLTYQIDQQTNSYDLSGITGEGTLALDFKSINDDLSISGLKEDFDGVFRFNNAVFEVGENHGTDDNAKLASSNAMFVGQGSTLVMNGKQELGADLTLEGGSKLDFSSNSDSFQSSGISSNVLDLKEHAINLEGESENLQVSVVVDTTIQIDGANTSGSLMEAVRKQNDTGLSLVLIDNVGNGAADIANKMQLEAVNGEDSQHAVVTYTDKGKSIADITTGVGLNSHGDQIGLSYSEVNEVAIYDNVEAVFESTGKGDTISAKITNKNGGVGSVRFTGTGTVTLTNSENDYSGNTTIDAGAQVVADGNSTLGNSQRVVVKDEGSSLEIQGNQTIKGLEIAENAKLTVGDGKKVTVSGSNDSQISGALSGEGTIELVNSQLTYTNDVAQTLSVAFNTKDDSTFIKTGKGVLDFDQKLSSFNLALREGGVILSNDDSLGNLEISSGATVEVTGMAVIENLSGTGGIFNMAVAFGNGSRAELVNGEPGLYIVSGTGNHILNVTSANTNKGAEEQIKVIDLESGDADFTLASGGITSGGYDYTLEKTTSADGSGTEFYLSSVVGQEAIRKTTVTAGSYIGIAYAAQLFDLSLHDRVGNRDWINPVTGEKETTSLWMHHSMSHERFRDSTQQLRMRTTANTTMLGGDIIQFTAGEDGLVYAGLMGGYGTMDTKTRSKVTDLDSKAETDAWGVGAYAGWKANADGQIGPYVDGWVMFTHASSDVTGVDQDTDNVKGQGLSAQLEAGWGFKVGSVVTENGKIANFTVEPHASVTWFGMEYDEIHNAAQDVQFEGKDNIRTRLGARAILTEEGNKDFNAFVEANWVHNTKEYGATISGLTVDQTGSRNQGEARIGVDWRLTQDVSVWGRVGAAFGSDGYSEREGSVGIRYQF